MYSNFEHGGNGCEKIHFYSSIQHEIIDSYPYLQIISNKILKALCYIYNEKINRQNILDEESCSYLYYWLGYNILPHLSDKSLFQKIIKMIYDELYSSGMHSTCNYLYEKIDENTFNTYKLLFDYSKDHGNINLSTLYGDTTCDEHYKKVMNNYINTYRDAYENCTGTQRTNFYCKYFNKLFSKDQYKELTTFTCTKRRYDSAFSGAHRSRDIEPVASVPVPPDEVANLHGTSVPKHHGDLENNDYPNSYPHSYPNKGLPDQHTLNGNLILRAGENAEGGSSKTIAGSVAPVLGVSSISLLLYKVTPLGGFIRNFLGRNRNMHNPVEYMDSFNPYSDGMIPGDRRMNISYHRL
ncbi:hypothetical protein PVNG_03099 [Plasmodium vivax North Korean]|uniref:VIR protein n=1 Tax=Plasmodium vivax North Korean TaxID=1035514 RepID=A0A0J9TZN2_PLAVI|nr:hypothetical protein PVNG_03099 [Plasmodium vivax North Korean]